MPLVLIRQGISGAIYPFLILNEYGVPVIENYSVGRGILRAGYNFLPLIYFVIILGLVSLSWVYAVIKNRDRVFSLGNFLLSAFFFTMAWSAIRNFAFAFLLLPLAAVNLKNLLGEENKPFHRRPFSKSQQSSLGLPLC